MRHLSLIALLVALVAGLLPVSGALAADLPPLRQEADPAIAPFARFVASRPGMPDVRFYVSTTQGKAPLVLFIQGSGCAPVIYEAAAGKPAASVFSMVPLGRTGAYAAMAVEKPFAPAIPPASAGGATGCPAAFNAHFSMDTWLGALKTALGHALALPYVDRSRVLVIGVSEGATMAAALARDVPAITHVALLGATGPSQYYDFVVNAYAQGGDDAGRLRRLAELDAAVAAIQAEPGSGQKFVWGHSYRRWSSFFRESSLDNLARSRARVYLLSGMRDTNVPVLSTEAMHAQLKMLGRDVSMRRIPDAGHDLLPQGAGYGELEREYALIMGWFEMGPTTAPMPAK
jgi:pimeloyl-ACP methyl ester carboxylesterase